MTRLTHVAVFIRGIAIAVTGGIAAGVVTTSAACEVTQGYEVPSTPGDPDAWAQHVQAYVAPRCATLDCHGDPGRPLRIYGAEGLRAGDDRALPMTDLEFEANATAAVGVDPFADAASHRLVLTPLATSAGGWHHVGGDIWLTRDDPGYQCLRQWLAGDDPTASCAAAAASVPRGGP